MPKLPARPDLDQLRRRADDLLHAARRGEDDALARLGAVSEGRTLDSALLAVAREHGFSSWTALRTEVDRREILDRCDVAGLDVLLTEQPELARTPMRSWGDHPCGTSPLAYVAMLRYDTEQRVWRDVPGTGDMAKALLAAGAPVDGDPGDPETPLITAASYGDAEVARVLVEAGADLAATATATAGGVPGATALRHAVVFGMTAVADVLVAAGATDLGHAATTGDVTQELSAGTTQADRVAALRIAAEHGRLGVIDQLLAADTPVDGVDRDGSTALHEAAYSGRADSVRHLLSCGADPAHADTRFHSTPLGWCRHRAAESESESGHGHGHADVEQILTPLTPRAS